MGKEAAIRVWYGWVGSLENGVLGMECDRIIGL